ncbi:MAG: extracellular solute-binding protein [Candidatus Latescibacteria bacterium]|nr:extracellular solute-binding protein [Candidatus Latescibacterota bacterium]
MRDLALTLAVLALLLASWFALNYGVLQVYPPDPSEGGKYKVIRWASDPNPARTEQIALFNRLYEDQKVRVVLDPSADVQKILTQAAAGTGPDVFDIYSYSSFALYVSKGVLLPIDEQMRQANLDLDAFWPQRRNALAIPGEGPGQYRIYCVPNNVTASVTFFNRSLYDAAARELRTQGVEVPPLPWNHWTWWDYVRLCQALTHKSADGRRYETFGSGGAGFGGGLSDFLYQAGGSLLSEDGTQVLLDSPAGRAACQYLYDLANTFHVAPSAEDQSAQTGGGGWGGQSILGLFTAGKLGSIFIGRWGLIKVRREARFTVEIYPLPRYVPYPEWERWMRDPRLSADPSLRDGPWGEERAETRNRGKAAELGGRVTGINKNTRYPQEAFYFLEYLSSPDYNNLLTKDADAFGSRREFSLEYFSRPDPAFPEEDQHRPALLDAMDHTRPERAAAHGAAFEIARLQNSLTTNLVNAAYQPADPGQTFTYLFLGPTPDQPVLTNPTVGQAAAVEMAARMSRELETGRRRQVLSNRDHLPDLFGIVLAIAGLVLGARYLIRRQGAAA